MTASVALLTLPILLAATATSLHALIAWRFIQGLFMPGIIAVTMAYVSDEWADGGAPTVMAAYVAGNVLGGVTGRFLSGLLASHFGWQATFLALGLLNALGAAAVWRYLPPERPTPNYVPSPPFLPALRDMLRHLQNPALLATFLIGSSALFALVATFTYITFHLAGPPFSLGTAALGSLFLVYLVGVVVTPFAGPWIERTGHRRALIAATLASAAGVALTLLPSLFAVVVGLASAPPASSSSNPPPPLIWATSPHNARSAAAGLYTTFYYAGGTLGAALPAIAWSVGAWPACVLTIILILLAIIPLATTYWPHHTAANFHANLPPKVEELIA